jgi:hypothetical protein
MTKQELEDMMKKLPSQQPREPLLEKIILCVALSIFLIFLFRLDVLF